MATDMTASGSPEEKLRWAFKMYDKDGSGNSTNKNISVQVFVKIVSQNFVHSTFSRRLKKYDILDIYQEICPICDFYLKI